MASDNLQLESAIPMRAEGARESSNARLVAYYLSRDRVLQLMGASAMPAPVLAALQAQDIATSAAVLSGAVGSYVLSAIRSGGIKTLQQLAVEGTLKPGSPFIYNGHFYGKGFAYSNKSPALTLTEKLDEPMAGKKLTLEFSKNGLINATAYTRMSGSTRLFAFGYVTEIDAEAVRAVPYVIGDLVDGNSPMHTPFAPSLELQPAQIDQFSGMDPSWLPSKREFEQLRNVSEHAVKTLICELLGEYEVPPDWGGEECDVFSANLSIGGARHTAAFLLKGPAKFHPMTLKDCGKNGDQIYRLFNIPAHVYIVQHCHLIGPAVRKTIEAFALSRTFVAPCRYVVIDGIATARLLRAHGLWKEGVDEEGAAP